MRGYTPSNRSRRCPARSVTMAFFQARVIPMLRPRRRILPTWRSTLTESTCTFLLAKASSTARLIWILLASGATSKTYLPPSPRTVLFSETTGRMMVLKESNAVTTLPPWPRPDHWSVFLSVLEPLIPSGPIWVAASDPVGSAHWGSLRGRARGFEQLARPPHCDPPRREPR